MGQSPSTNSLFSNRYEVIEPERNILPSYLSQLKDRIVIVDFSGCRVAGKLLSYSESDHDAHKPFVLILETQQGKAIMRGWDKVILP